MTHREHPAIDRSRFLADVDQGLQMPEVLYFFFKARRSDQWSLSVGNGLTRVKD
jgi:hypothetical protein